MVVKAFTQKELFTPEEQGEVTHELFALVSKHNLRTSFGAVAAVVMLFSIAYDRVALPLLFAWFLFAMAAQANRVYALRAPFPENDPALLYRKNYYLVSAFITSVSNISYLFFFDSLTEAERAVITLIILGLCAGSTANNAGLRRGFLYFSIPLLSALILVWAITPFTTLPKWLDISMAVLIAFFGAVLNEMSKNTQEIFEETFLLRFKDRDQKRRLEKALEDAETANKTKTRFLAAASHDLRQPLHTISLVSATLSLHHLQQESLNLVNILNQVSMSLSAQLNDLLDISKLDAGIVKTSLQPTHVNVMLRNLASEFDLELKEKKLDLNLRLTSEKQVLVDPQLMYRILRNLTHNAIKFTEKGNITFTTHDTNDHVCITIADTGCGIDQAHQQEIFQEFYQVSNDSRDRSKGFGLGLSIVARLAQLLGINMTVKSALNEGSHFTLSVPQYLNHADNADATPDFPQKDKQQFSLKVLIIDDDAMIRTSTRLLLEAIGCSCLEASDIASTKIAVQQTVPDFILADYRLANGETGFQAIQIAHKIHPSPAVLVTGDTAPDVLKSIQTTDLHVMHKPMTLKKLYSALALAQTIKDKSTASNNTA